MLAYERAPWTDEHLNAMPSKEEFELPEVEGAHARWRWVDGEEWHIDQGDSRNKKDDDDDGEGWIYYDSKWKDGRRGTDGWGRYTRRRKWYRDAELVEITPSTEVTPARTPVAEQSDQESASDEVKSPMSASTATIVPPSSNGSTAVDEDDISVSGSARKRNKGWFRRRASSKAESQQSVGAGSVGSSSLKSYPDEDDEYRPSSYTQRNEDWSRYGDDIGMQLG